MMRWSAMRRQERAEVGRLRSGSIHTLMLQSHAKAQSLQR